MCLFSGYDTTTAFMVFVHPMLMEKPGKRFFLIAGDVGGNPEAIAAFYDRWNHITFLASGMGEVPDENYLLVHVYGDDSLDFELVALDGNQDLPEPAFFSIPPAPSAITGPGPRVQKDQVPPQALNWISTLILQQEACR